MSSEPSWTYKLKDSINEGQQCPSYSVSFNDRDPAQSSLLASCTGRRVTIYDCVPDGRLVPIQAYVDESAEEEFYVVRWNQLGDTTLLLAAGLQGIIRVLNCQDQTLIWSAIGHGSSVNDIAVHPSNPDLFVTASRDCSLRMWNLVTKVCVLIVCGEESHTNEVLSVDFHPFNPHILMSSGMDDTIKIWSLRDVEEGIQKSREYDSESGLSFKTTHMSHPIFSTRKIHWNYVDCVRWMGDLIMSKSVENKILLWEPSEDLDVKSRSKQANSTFRVLQEFCLEDADIWFIRFSMDIFCKILVCGSRFGRVFVFDLTAPSRPARRPKTVLRVPVKEKATIRQTAVSSDGSIIIACCEDATIHRFDRQPLPKSEAPAASKPASNK